MTQSEKNLQDHKNDGMKIAPPQLNILTGDFAQVPNQMLEQLMKLDLPSIEFKICFFMLRELTGWGYQMKPIEIAECAVKIEERDEKKIIKAFKSLVTVKKVLIKTKIPGYRTPLYGFNPEMFPNSVVGKPKDIYIDGPKVIDLKKFKLLKVSETPPSTCQNYHFQGGDFATKNSPEAALGAASGASKYPLIPLNTHRGGGLNNFESMRQRLLKDFPQDERRIEKTYKQIERNGYEKEGCSPFRPANLCAWFEKIYPQIRREYDHHADRQQRA